MGMVGCNTFTLLCFSTHSLPLSPKTNSPQYSFRPSFVSCCTKYGVDRWCNPNSRPQSFDPLEVSRHWIESNSSSRSNSEERFTVVSYNILGDRNASKHTHLYPLVPSEYMKWDRRKTLICEELIGWSSDFICLQEVDKYYDLLRIMEKEGYVGSYKRRTGDTVDGCAMFWKADKFRLLEGQSITFKEFGFRDNVAQLSVFEMCRADSRRVLVCNIHVLFSPKRGDVKLGQIRLLMSRAHTLSEKWGNVPIMLVGDFNSTPQSALYQFLSSSELDLALHDKRNLSGQWSSHPQTGGFQEHMSRTILLMDRFTDSNWTVEELIAATGKTTSTIAEHPLKLKSSYASIKGSTMTRDSLGEPLATSFHSKFLGTVDYLWYSEGLAPTRVLDTLPIDILKKTRGLPHEKLGSDHLPLVSEFAFTEKN